MGQTQTVHLPPWIPATPAEKDREDDFREAVLKLSATSANLIAPHPLASDPEFCFDWVGHRPFAEAAYGGDRRLHRLLPKLVPKRISEEDFWRNYFSHVFAVKRRFELGYNATAALPEEEAAAANGASTPWAELQAEGMPTPATAVTEELVTPAVPSTPKSPGTISKTVSYPDKFHLALKYASEGPPLPNLSDADRILLEALQQQATLGECNRPRPGMWGTAEEKAKYEAWKKLGSMSRAEAMHLYVQAIEVFDERWLEWRGLRDAVAAAVGALTPAPVQPNGRGTRLDVLATLASMRTLRAALPTLPPAQVSAVREESNALAGALAALSGPPPTR